MKKTLSIICVIISVVMAFTGCLRFSSHLIDETTTQANNETTVLTETTTDAGSTDVNVIESTTAEVVPPVGETTTNLPEGTTDGGNTVTPAPETTTSASVQENTTNVVSTKSDYDILREGVFYCKGKMVDSTGTAPMEMAFSGNSVYITTDIDGVGIGMLFNDKDVYMIYVDKKTYTEIGETMLKTMDIDKDEMLKSMDFGFASFGNLEEADEKTTATVNGATCDCYVFRNDNGSMTHIYMSGNTLKGFASADSSGKVISANYIDYFSADVPDYMIDPSVAFTKQNMITFMSSLMSVMA